MKLFIVDAAETRAVLLIYLTFICWSPGDSVANCQEAGKSQWLQVAGFGLTARVRVIQQDSARLDEEIIVREYYSNVEHRAKLEFTILKWHESSFSRDKQEISYHFSSNGAASSEAPQLLKVISSWRGLNCEPATAQMLAHDLFGSASSADGLITGAEWLNKRDDVPDHLVGLARLLIIVDANKERLTKSSGPNTITRNQETVRYTLKDMLAAKDENEPTQLMVYYTKSTDAMASEVAELPLKIWLLFKDEVEIIVEYSMVAQIDYEAAATKSIEGQNLFAFPLGAGCSNHLPLARLVREQMAPRLMSFRATVVDILGDNTELKYFVAFDGFNKLLRRDTIASSRGSDSVTIHDLKRRLKYNIATVNEGGGGSQFGTQRSGKQCAIFHHESQQNLEHDPVLPLDGMVHMGSASVRGVDAVVFEVLVDQLPELIFPQVSYLDMKGTNRSKYLPNMKTREQTYCLNYYFSAHPMGSSADYWASGQPLGQLLRIEAMQQNYPAFRIEVEDFLWELSDAPNGDRVDELFALGDRCTPSEELRPENSANLNMELEFRVASQHAEITAKEAFVLVENTRARNRGLVQALDKSSQWLRATQIRDVESRVKAIASSSLANAPLTFWMEVSAKLDHQPGREILRPVCVGKGRLRKPVRPLRAANFEECTWQVAHRFRQSRYMLYSFCYMSCLVDEKPVLGAQEGKLMARSSSVFELSNDEHMPCEVLRLDAMATEQVQAARGGSWWSMVRQDLDEKDMSFLVPEYEHIGELLFSIKSLEITNDRWSSVNGPSGFDTPVDERVLEGVGLSASAGSVTRVAAKEPEGFNEDYLPAPAMSYSVCHSSCLASLKCSSFSLCSSSDQLECLISELSFRDTQVLREIAQKSSEVQSKSKRALITVDISSGGYMSGGDASNQTTSTPVELKVDRRCHLYNKRALDLFSPAKLAISAELKNRSLAPANSEEQCAELCLTRNVHFFRRSAKTRSLLTGEPLEEEDETTRRELVSKVRKQEERNLRHTWCSSFAFIDLDTLPGSVRATIDPAKLSQRGLCYTPKPPAPIKTLPKKPVREKADGRQQQPRVHLHKYDFIYSSLYEPQPGLRLLTRTVNKELEVEKMTAEEARQYALGNNYQAAVGARNLETCARLCFTQNTPVKPWCRSFGFMKHGDERGQQYYCIFNSLSAADAEKSPLKGEILIKTPVSARFTHYEPNDFLSLENILVTQAYGTEGQTEGQPFTLETISILLVVLVAMISGTVLALLIGDRVVDRIRPRRESIENPSRSFLNSLVECDSSDITHRSFVEEEDIALPELVGSSSGG